MNYKLLGIFTLFTPVVLIAPTVAQINRIDPKVFIKGQITSCEGCNLQGANLRNQDRANAELRQADLRNANLSNGNFRSAYLTCANLSGANLKNTDFSYANFVNANLSSADLSGADLSRTDLSGVIFDASTNLNNVNLEGAKLWDGQTIYTPGLDLKTIPRNIDLEKQKSECNEEQ